MSLYDYEASVQLDRQDVPFYALIMAAMRKAGGINVTLLQASWPGVWDELQQRYNAPGGRLASDSRGARHCEDCGETGDGGEPYCEFHERMQKGLA